MIGSTTIEDLASAGSNDAHGAAIAFALMGACGLFYAITRATAVRRTFATSRRKVDASLTLLQAVARVQRARAAMFATGCALASLALVTAPVAVEIRIVWAVTGAVMLAIGLLSIWRLQRLLALHDAPHVRVTEHGHFLFAARGARLVGWVAAPPAVIARSMPLPAARLR